MSERAAMAGDNLPPQEIYHNGKTYKVASVITEGVMLAMEMKLYARAKEALAGARTEYSEAGYDAELTKLREKFEKGGYAFESKGTMEFLKTEKGCMTLLGCMMDCNTAELIELMANKGPELKDVMKLAMNLSMPKPPPKVKPRNRPVLKRSNRGRS